MKINDYIFLARTNLSRRKKSVIISSILIVVSMLILILSLSFTNSLNELINKSILNNVSYRTIVVSGGIDSSSDSLIESLKDTEHIIKVMDQNDYSTGTTKFTIDNNEVSGNISFMGADSDIHPNIIAGRNIGENEKNVCIVPKSFYPYGDISNYDKNKIIDGQELIGKKIDIKYNSYYHMSDKTLIKDTFTKKFEIVGVYDNEDSASRIDECYIPFEDIYEIHHTSEENSIVADNVIMGKSRTVFAIIDNPLNMEYVINELNNSGYSRVMPRSVANTDLVNIVKLVGLLASSVILTIVIFNLIISNIKSINERSYEIGMLKAVGYKDENIRNIIYFENIIIGFVSYIITILIASITMIFIKNNIISGNYKLEIINLNLNYNVCLISLIISILIPLLVARISSKKALKKSIIQLNKEG